MGSLSANISAEDLPQTVSVSMSLSGGFATTITVPVDYSPALDAAELTFMEVATSLVPVDTGYLQSTIHAEVVGLTVSTGANAEYASYVEYGTWKMAAQPYFTPAMEAANEAFMNAAQECINMAYAEISDIVGGFNMNGGAISALQGQVGGAAMSSGALMMGSILGSIIVGAATTFIQAATGHDFTGNDNDKK